jgi:hypothetical protein
LELQLYRPRNCDQSKVYDCSRQSKGILSWISPPFSFPAIYKIWIRRGIIKSGYGGPLWLNNTSKHLKYITCNYQWSVLPCSPSIILNISSSISRYKSFIFLTLASLYNLGRTICAFAVGLPVLESISVFMFFYNCD